MDLARAAIAIDAAQIKGVLPLPLSSLRSTLPVFKNPGNKNKAVSLTAEQFRYSFGNAVSEEESNELYEKWSIPAPGKPLFEAAAANFSLHSPAKVDTDNDERGPLLLIMGGQDHTVPEAITKSTLKQYKHSYALTELMEFEDRGHSLTIDHGWREVADQCLAWLDKQGLTGEHVMAKRCLLTIARQELTRAVHSPPGAASASCSALRAARACPSWRSAPIQRPPSGSNGRGRSRCSRAGSGCATTGSPRSASRATCSWDPPTDPCTPRTTASCC